MDDRELETLLNDLECDRVERKASMSDRSKIRQAICAFANDLPDRPTNLGILVTGKSPRMFIPGAYIQFLRIDGIELSDPIINQKAIDGYLDRMLRLLDETFILVTLRRYS